jgi:hypothetical protein
VITLLQQCKLKGVYFVRNGEDEVVGDWINAHIIIFQHSASTSKRTSTTGLQHKYKIKTTKINCALNVKRNMVWLIK